MRVAVSFLVVAIAANQIVDAGHHHSGNSASSNEIIVSGKTEPEVIEESDRIRRCPNGFKQYGKQCIHTVTVQPTAHCPSGFFRTMEHEEVCAKFFDRVLECPADFVREKGVCVRTRQVEPFVQCHPGFTMMSDGRQCSRLVPLPNKHFCPHGSVQRGEVCVKKSFVAAEFVCPPGFTLVEDQRCKIVETFDCTPEQLHVGKESVSSSHKHHKKHLRLLGQKENIASSLAGKELPPTESEFVVQKTCKRVRMESARKICPKGSGPHGKDCFVEDEVEFYEQKGGFKEEIVKAIFVCPEGHFPSSPVGRFQCLFKEEVLVHGICPSHTEEVDHKCAKFRPLIVRCPTDHKLEDGVCVRTIIAPPIVEYNVAFKCVGKDCDHHFSSSKHGWSM